MYARDNVYAAGATAFAGESDPVHVSTATVSVVEEGDEVYLTTNLSAEFDDARIGPVTGRDLERVRFADAEFEEPDGTPAMMDMDLTGAPKPSGRQFAAGPVAGLTSRETRTRIW